MNLLHLSFAVLALLSVAAFFLRNSFALGVDPAGTHSDGSLVWGTQEVTIPTAATPAGEDYIAEGITTDADTKILQSMNAFGVPNKEVIIELPFTGSCTLQLADATIDPPAIGGRFTLTPIGGGTAINCKVSKVGQVRSQDGEAKVSIDFRKVLNP